MCGRAYKKSTISWVWVSGSGLPDVRFMMGSELAVALYCSTKKQPILDG